MTAGPPQWRPPLLSRRLRHLLRAAGRDFCDATGITGTPRRALILSGTVLSAALVAAVVGLAAPVEMPATGGLPPVARLGAAAALTALAQLARLSFRVASGTTNVTWGDTALIIALYLAPPGWLPAATFVGAGLAWLLLSLSSDRGTPLEVVHVVASLTAAVAIASTVTAALADPFDAALTPALAGALTLGALTSVLVTAGLAALTRSIRHQLPVGPLLRSALQGKLLMFVGNVLVGLVVVIMIDHDARWMLLLPPVLWLLHQTYGHRLRADDERRAWQSFAGAMRAFNQLDERRVAAAGIGGAQKLFGAERAEIDVLRPEGGRRRYCVDGAGDLVESEVTGPPPDPDGILSTRPLIVNGVRVGELRVQLPPSGLPDPYDQALSAFSDALAAALHNAATHHELRAVTARWSYEAVHDPLTRLLNRAAMLDKGDAVLRELAHGHPVALLLLDLKHFRDVNDTLGHAAGEELLKIAAGRLRALTRPGELLARLGGDEFALLVTALPVLAETTALGDGATRRPQALRRAREIVEDVARPTEVAGVKISAEASVGVVVAGAGTADMAELLRRADIARYQAKEGEGSVACYDSARDTGSTDELALLVELREALVTDDQLVLALQPAVDLTTGAPTGVEALIRWRHPRRGNLNPIDFVRPIEGSDLLGSFTRYVVDQALAVAAEWAHEGLDLPISVNLSARSLLDPRLPADIAELLRRHDVPARRLVLEITETVVMSEMEVIDEVLAGLREVGVQLALDDFGTGFSSLTFLTRVAVDELKIDRSFVGPMVDSPEAGAIVRATVELGRELGLRVVAEGVETADQLAALAAMGCTAAQGYHFFKPMPADKIVAVLRSLLDAAQAQVFPLRADGAS